MASESSIADLREALRNLGLQTRPTAGQLRRLLERCGAQQPGTMAMEELSALARSVVAAQGTGATRGGGGGRSGPRFAQPAFVPTKRNRAAAETCDALQGLQPLQGVHVHQEQQQQQLQQLQQHSLLQEALPGRPNGAENFAPHALGSRKRRRQSGALCSADEAREAAFAAFVDPDTGRIGPEGMLRLCHELGVQPEDPVMIVLSWVMRAQELGVFTRIEFLSGLEALQVRSLEEIRVTGKLEALRAMLDPQNPDFVGIYRFTYAWACEPGQRCLSKDMALALWPLVLVRFQSVILPDFLRYLGSVDSLRGIPRDLWMQTLQFVQMYKQRGPAFLETFDPDTGAWPVVIDDFALARRGDHHGS
ncbi:DCN1-like protein [Hondaea fermentalgiana]|uniref:Defective in cullin neddylation protein n=1 Tax=Hondaea fermentalgiana TaxID=2315210 RepID=A0A2R5GLA9_9STRA|nr:DCN1-like protein [Hondaea fermentalgiana]|eukprot:GBG28664.1 DCN1-like protein [Hondaea fermentalgiana]